MTVAMDQASTSFTGSRGDQSVCERKPLRHGTADVEGGESHSLIDGNDLVQQLLVILHRTARLFGRRPEIPQAPGKLGERKTGGHNLGIAGLEDRLHALPPKLLAIVS